MTELTVEELTATELITEELTITELSDDEFATIELEARLLQSFAGFKQSARDFVLGIED